MFVRAGGKSKKERRKGKDTAALADTAAAAPSKPAGKSAAGSGAKSATAASGAPTMAAAAAATATKPGAKSRSQRQRRGGGGGDSDSDSGVDIMQQELERVNLAATQAVDSSEEVISVRHGCVRARFVSHVVWSRCVVLQSDTASAATETARLWQQTASEKSRDAQSKGASVAAAAAAAAGTDADRVCTVCHVTLIRGTANAAPWRVWVSYLFHCAL